MIVLIDNYDSFVYNLARYMQELGQQTRVIRNDKITPTELEALQPEALILSPGPCGPVDAGRCLDILSKLSSTIPVLGVCLGHQCIAKAFGATISRAPEPVHGRTSSITHTQRGLFKNLSNPFRATRYHSLIVSEDQFPECLQITARTCDGLIMAIQHRNLPIAGVQFHPESILTEWGHHLLNNFLHMANLTTPTTSSISMTERAFKNRVASSQLDSEFPIELSK